MEYVRKATMGRSRREFVTVVTRGAAVSDREIWGCRKEPLEAAASRLEAVDAVCCSLACILWGLF